MTDFRTAFPDFPAESVPAIPADWTDVSYRNDACPSWMTPDEQWQIFVNYPDPEMREYQGSPRFMFMDAVEADEELSYGTDDWEQLLRELDRAITLRRLR